MNQLPFISAEFIEAHTNFNDLVNALRQGFSGSIETPQRHHHDFSGNAAGAESTLLLMPAWQTDKNLGVKIVTVSPDNAAVNLPSIHGIYILIDAKTGIPKALLDGTALTAKRTAAASALAASYLAQDDAASLLMIGTGALAPNLIRAHISQRPVKQVWIWGRCIEKAERLKKTLTDLDVQIDCVADLENTLGKAAIVSCATLSKTPLVRGALLKNGQHIDLVGAYKKDMREADDAVMRKAQIFIDTQQGIHESGDLHIPLETGVITPADIQADLTKLCTNSHKGRIQREDLTLFKSVGHASEDLIAANYYFKKQNENG